MRRWKPCSPIWSWTPPRTSWTPCGRRCEPTARTCSSTARRALRSRRSGAGARISTLNYRRPARSRSGSRSTRSAIRSRRWCPHDPVPVALIRVSQVSVAVHSEDDLWGAHIDTPATGHETETYGLDVRGWALGRSLPVASIEVMHGGDCIWRVAPDVPRADVAEQHPDVPGAATSGFFAPVNALTLPREWELRVRARL